MMVANDRKATLREIHTSADNQAVNRQEVVNVVLDDRPPLIDNNKKDLTRKELTTLAQLRSGHCRPLGSYKSRINKDASLNVCTNCGRTSHDVNHLFKCPAHPTTVSNTVGFMEQISGRHPGTQISRGRRTILKSEQQQ